MDSTTSAPDPARDFAALRSPNALLQSEGFYASFFFGLLMRGTAIPDSATLLLREQQVLQALADVLGQVQLQPDTPYLLRFLAAFVRIFPAASAEVNDVFLDLTHGVFVDRDAEGLWRRQYLASIRVDRAGLARDSLDARRARWRELMLTNPDVAFLRLGPQVRCVVARVHIRMLGQSSPLTFDANTAPEGVLQLVPGLTTSGVGAWLTARAQHPLTSWSDLTTRVPAVRRLTGVLRCAA